MALRDADGVRETAQHSLIAFRCLKERLEKGPGNFARDFGAGLVPA
jgi:hypothetical protein